MANVFSTYVKFMRGTPDAYEALTSKNSDTLYFVSETDATTGQLYLGEKLIAAGANDSQVASYLKDLQDVNITGAIQNSLLGYDIEEHKWIPMLIEDLLGSPATEDSAASGIFEDIYTKEEVDNAIASAVVNASNLKRKIVADIAEIETYLGKDDAEQYIFMIAIPDATGSNHFEEYIILNNAVEQVGSWQVDLSDYATKEEVQIVQTQVQNLEKLLNGYENEDGTKVPSNFITRVEFNAAVGNLEELLTASQNIVSRIETLETNMQWQNIEG